jgi:mono/diheme cytochrome c family protein
VPRWFYVTLVLLAVLSLIPLALIARTRATLSSEPRIHLVPDMDNQPAFRAQSANPLFADGRAMRPPVPHTVARGELRDDEHLEQGKSGGEWAAGFPGQLSLSRELMERGRERYDIFCAPCHGLVGEGDGMVARSAERLQEGAWVPPSSLHTDLVRGRPNGHLYNTITHGIRTMPAYGSQIPVEDRWAVVAYVRALQRSRNARIGDVPEDRRAGLRTE